MRVERLAPSAGWDWARAGFAIFRRQPFAMATLLLALAFAATLLLFATPVMGALLLVVLMPTLTVLIMALGREIESGRPFSPRALAAALGDRAAMLRLVVLGVAYLAGSSAVLGLSVLLDGGTFLGILQGDPGQAAAPPSDAAVLVSGVLVTVSVAVMSMALWYAPVLTAWHGIGPVKALFFSLVAVWRNRWAFAVYLLVMGALALALQMAIMLINALLPSGVGVFVLAPLIPLAISLVYCSFYPTYTGVFPDAVR